MRKQSGLSQRDLAHLLGVDQSRVSLFESGERMPSQRHICQLSLIFGKPVESLLVETFAISTRVLRKRLSTLSQKQRRFYRLANRQRTLSALAERLDVANESGRGSV